MKASVSAVAERYTILAYSDEGKYGEYFDMAADSMTDKDFSMIRAHISSIQHTQPDKVSY